jgi:N-acetylglucosaminyldiphosphoundecaprenol N-acetyl-beta-D-mannosaminyltransferase
VTSAARPGGGGPVVGPRSVVGVGVERVVLGGTPCDLVTADDLHELLDRAMAPGAEPVLVASANLDHVHWFGRRGVHAGFFETPSRHDRWLVLLDGAPLVTRAGRITGRRWPLLPGSGLLPEVLGLAEERGATVGVVGGREEMHERLRAVVAERWPALRLVGTWAPEPARLAAADGRAALAAAVRAAGVDVLVVCLGKPKQELWLDEFVDVLRPRLGLCFGAAADFLAGDVRRAPAVVRRVKGEWLWRLVSDPGRLWRRYLVQGPPAYLELRRASAAAPGRSVTG